MRHVDNIEEYNELVKQATLNNQLIFIKFGAKWCKPCKAIMPFFEKLSNKYKKHIFIEIDVEELEDLSEEFDIAALPTFSMIKNKKYKILTTGCNEAHIEKNISENIKNV